MERTEIERYIDKQIAKSKKDAREVILMDINEIFIKAAQTVNQNTTPKDILQALRYQVENKLRMQE